MMRNTEADFDMSRAYLTRIAKQSASRLFRRAPIGISSRDSKEEIGEAENVLEGKNEDCADITRTFSPATSAKPITTLLSSTFLLQWVLAGPAMLPSSSDEIILVLQISTLL